MSKTKKKAKRPKAPFNREFWDTNQHTILMLESLLRDAKSPGERFALKRALRILRAITDEM